MFKHMLHNPFIEEDEEVSNVSISQISHKYLGSDHHHKFLELGRGVKPQTDIDFKPFKYFNPATELLSMNNQLSVEFSQVKNEAAVSVVL